MKADPYFKFLAVIIALGLVLALTDPTPPTEANAPSTALAANATTAAVKG